MRSNLPAFASAEVQAEVRVFVEEEDGQACIKYEWTAAEVVRAFALDVMVDQGRIIGISDFFVGESTGRSFSGGFLTITLEGGELQCAPSINGPWIANGNTSGVQVESSAVATNRFVPVRNL